MSTVNSDSDSLILGIGFSHQFTNQRFGCAAVAATYPSEYRRRGRDRWERNAILRALANVRAGSHVLDLPCGTGRSTRLLTEQGYDVTAADASAEMMASARQNLANVDTKPHRPGPPVRFEVCDVMATGFADGAFDAVLCNRLFHHFAEPGTRRAALAELRRVTRGQVIVSFFNSFALSAVKFRLIHSVRGVTPIDRIPIPFSLFVDDVHASGLRVESRVSVRWGISPQWYLVLRRA